MCVIEYDGSPAFAPQVESYFREVVLVFFQLFVSVVVFVVAVVESLSVDECRLVIPHPR